MFKKNILIAAFLGLFLCHVSLAYGQETGLVPGTDRTCEVNGVVYDAAYCGNYEINDFVVLAINISKWILGMVGSLALIMFVYGGILFLISSGGSEKISQAKKIILAAVIGLIIVFTSYLIIKFVMGTMGLTWSGKIAVPTLTPVTTVTE